MDAVKLLSTHNIDMVRGDGEGVYTSDNTHTPHFCHMKLIGLIQNFSRYLFDRVAYDSENC